jgi:hypothetical protein
LPLHAVAPIERDFRYTPTSYCTPQQKCGVTRRIKVKRRVRYLLNYYREHEMWVNLSIGLAIPPPVFALDFMAKIDIIN